MVKEEQRENIECIHVVREWAKLERSSAVKAEQPANIQLIYLTFEVSKLERSREVKEEQPWNISIIFATFEVSKLERSSAVKEEQPENIRLMSVTSEVLRLSNPRISSKAVKPSNHPAVVLGKKFRNDSSMTTFVTSAFDATSSDSHAGVLWSF